MKRNIVEGTGATTGPLSHTAETWGWLAVVGDLPLEVLGEIRKGRANPVA
ncbi:MAG: hypothetical protein KY450_11110 [Actinobacteria bacterium]|nr:hypothetical protein [Actinomycetota bacterium]